MLSMLPKFELVPMSTYFMMLPKLRRPSMTPSCRTLRPLFEQDDVGRVARHVDGVVDRDADVGGRSDGASLMPSPR